MGGGSLIQLDRNPFSSTDPMLIFQGRELCTLVHASYVQQVAPACGENPSQPSHAEKSRESVEEAKKNPTICPSRVGMR